LSAGTGGVRSSLLYRAFVENRREEIVVDSAVHLDLLCDGLAGVQSRLELCAGFDSERDAFACIRGTGTSCVEALRSSGLPQ
jgi:hypothetical protein